MELLAKGREEVKPIILKLSIVIAFSFTGFLLSQYRSKSLRIQPIANKKETSNSKKKEAEEKASTTETTSSSSSTITTEKKCSRTEEAQSKLPKTNNASSPKQSTQNEPNAVENESDRNREEEISRLKQMVQTFQEKEKYLDQQLSNYQGTQEQEIAMKELESKLKVCKVEGRIYDMRIESLKAENQRLLTFEEEAKVKVRSLKKKLKEVEEENGILAGLHRKATILHEDKLRKLIEHDHKLVALQKKHSELTMEKSELSQKLELAQHEGAEVQTALKEAESLRRDNLELSREIEQLKADQFRDTEELVYLRWVNACLRFELRNYNPQSGKMCARDLNINLSHESKEKAKHLVLEYANSIYELDSEYPSSSEEPWLTVKPTPSPKHENHSSHTNHGKKPEFFNKLAKLMLGKKIGRAERRASMSSGSFEEMSGGESYQKSSPSGSDDISQNGIDIIKRKKITDIKLERKLLESEKDELRRFADELNKSMAIQKSTKKSTSFST